MNRNMSNNRPAATSWAVTARSSGEGLTDRRSGDYVPNITRPAARSAMASRNTSRGWTSDELSSPRVTVMSTLEPVLIRPARPRGIPRPADPPSVSRKNPRYLLASARRRPQSVLPPPCVAQVRARHGSPPHVPFQHRRRRSMTRPAGVQSDGATPQLRPRRTGGRSGAPTSERRPIPARCANNSLRAQRVERQGRPGAHEVESDRGQFPDQSTLCRASGTSHRLPLGVEGSRPDRATNVPEGSKLGAPITRHQNHAGCYSRRSVALLELLAGSARTGVVSPDVLPILRRIDRRHRCRRAGSTGTDDRGVLSDADIVRHRFVRTDVQCGGDSATAARPSPSSGLARPACPRGCREH